MREKCKLSLDMALVQMLSIAFVVPVGLMVIPYWLLHGSRALAAVADSFSMGVLLGTFTLGIVVHELIHGIAWSFASGHSFRAIKFGFQWKTLTPYAHCPLATRCNAYRVGAVMPLIVLGICPYAVALISKSPFLLVFSLLQIFAACGDLMILWLLRGVSGSEWVQDHPTDAGVSLLEFSEASTSEHEQSS